MMFPIVRVDFPFLDAPWKSKSRPALCLTQPLGRHGIVVLSYITTNEDEQLETDLFLSEADAGFGETGLRASSVVKLHKLASLPKEYIFGIVGRLPSSQEELLEKKLSNLFQCKRKAK